MIAKFARKNKHSIIQHKKMNNRLGSQDTITSRHTAPTTGYPGQTRRHAQHSSTIPKKLPRSWRTLCGIAHGRQTDASSRVPDANFALCYDHVTASKKVLKSECSFHVIWRPTSCGPHTNATRHKRATHANATGAEDSTGPTPALQQSLSAAHQKQQ